MAEGVLDEAYERMHQTGPEFRGWLSNHGPMAADALVRLGGSGVVHRWLDAYSSHLEAAPAKARALPTADWQDALGDETRLAAWLARMAREVQEQPWQDVLATWWPRLLPGVLAGATHGVIRTGHAVRALREVDNQVRRAELAQALGYWAARWQPVPHATMQQRPALAPDRRVPAGLALDGLPFLDSDPDDGIRSRVTELSQHPDWPAALFRLDTDQQPEELLRCICAEAAARFPAHAVGDSVMLVHAVTAPAAIALVLPSLDPALHRSAAWAAWSASAAVTAAYRLRSPTPVESHPPALVDADEVMVRAVEHGDAHVLKLAEAALRTAAPDAARRAVAAAVAQIPTDA